MSSIFRRVTNELKGLPGIGPKSAERIVFYLLSAGKEKSDRLARSIVDLNCLTSACKKCGLISEYNPCRICSSPHRNQDLICVVKSVQDALIIERSRSYDGVYHVLNADIVDDDVEEKKWHVESLIRRLGGSKELLFAFESSAESEEIIHFVMKKVKQANKTGVIFSRMAVGIPIGAGLEYVDDDTLRQSVKHRYHLDK